MACVCHRHLSLILARSLVSSQTSSLPEIDNEPEELHAYEHQQQLLGRVPEMLHRGDVAGLAHIFEQLPFDWNRTMMVNILSGNDTTLRDTLLAQPLGPSRGCSGECNYIYRPLIWNYLRDTIRTLKRYNITIPWSQELMRDIERRLQTSDQLTHEDFANYSEIEWCFASVLVGEEIIKQILVSW